MAHYLDLIRERTFAADWAKRPLDWRFRRAELLSEQSGKNISYLPGDDDFVKRASRFIRSLKACETAKDLEKAEKSAPDIYAAYTAYLTLPAMELALLDALVLCRNGDKRDIADRTGFNAEIQDAYRNLFFDVDTRRNDRLWISAQLLEPNRIRQAFVEPQMGVWDIEKPKMKVVEEESVPDKMLRVIRFFGFISNPLVVEMLYSGFFGEVSAVGETSAKNIIANALKFQVTRNALFAAYDSDYRSEKISPYLKLAMDVAMAEGHEAQNSAVQNVIAFFQSTQMRVKANATEQPVHFLNGTKDVLEVMEPGNPR